MRRKLAVGAVLVVLVGIVVWWRLGRESAQPSSSVTARGSAAATAQSSRSSSSSAPEAKVSLSGRVTRSADGSPVAGAVVAVAPKRTIASMLPGARSDADADEWTATTGSDGAWTIANVPSGTYSVGANAAGLLPAGTEVRVADRDVPGIDLALAAGGAIASGTVSDVLGGPIPGAKVAVERESSNPLANTPPLVAFTDEQGRYALSLAPGDVRFVASHDAYTNAHRWLEMTADPVTVDFTLTPGAQIRGVVVTSDGTPLPDAAVSARADFRRAIGAGGSATTADDGTFALTGLTPGALELTAVGGGYSSASATTVEVGIGEQVDGVRLVVDKGFTISGRVVDKATPTRGVSGVRVGGFSITSGAAAFARIATGDDGAFRIDGVRPGNYMLFAIGDEVMPEVGKSIVVDSKDVTDVVIEMAVGVTITGRVEPPQVADISITPTVVGIANMFDALKAAMVRTESAADGTFTLRHAPPGTFTLTAAAKTGDAGEQPLLVAQSDVSGIVVKLAERASIAGRVVDDSGAAVTNVEVHANPAERKAMTMRFSARGDGTSARVRLDGTFVLVGLDAGTYGLTVTDGRGRVGWAVPPDKAKPSAPVEVSVVAATRKSGVTLTVERRDGVIRGVALLPDGTPAADTWITASLERPKPTDDEDRFDPDEFRARMSGGMAPVLTGADGRFTVDKLRRGTYRLVGESARGSARGQKEGVKLGETVTLQLTRLGTLSGKVTVNGTPVAPFDVECSPVARTGGSFDKHVTDASGYRFERMPPGEYECIATADAGRVDGKPRVTVPAGDATLDLPLLPYAQVTGSVVNILTGEPVVGVKIFARAGGMDRAALGDLLAGTAPTSDARGAFEVRRLAPGENKLVILPAAGGFQPLLEKPFTARAGERIDLGALKIVAPRDGEPGTLGMGTTGTATTLTVTDVTPGGPAATAGILAGDSITSINGVPVATVTGEVASMLLGSGSVAAGQKFLLGIDRAGSPQQISVTAAKW